MRNAGMLRSALIETGAQVFGGVDAPYVWFRPEGDSDSWKLFSDLLESSRISSTPGVGFGKEGEGWLRLTGFNTFELTEEACDRLTKI